MKNNKYKVIVKYKDGSYTTWKCKNEEVKIKVISQVTSNPSEIERVEYITSQMYPLKNNKTVKIVF